MDQPFLEFVMIADMIEMRVAGHRTYRSFGELGHLPTKAYHAHSRIDQEVVRSTADVPDIAAIERQDVRLMDMGDPLPHRDHFIPSLWGGDFHEIENSIGLGWDIRRGG